MAVNFFADPYAVKELLVLTENETSQAFPLERFILLPLDVTTPHEMSFPAYKTRIDPDFQSTSPPSPEAKDRDPIVHFTSAFFDRTRTVMLRFGKDAMELHDAVAIWCAIENPPPPEDEDLGTMPILKDGWRAVKRKFQVER